MLIKYFRDPMVCPSSNKGVLDSVKVKAFFNCCIFFSGAVKKKKIDWSEQKSY